MELPLNDIVSLIALGFGVLGTVIGFLGSRTAKRVAELTPWETDDKIVEAARAIAEATGIDQTRAAEKVRSRMIEINMKKEKR